MIPDFELELGGSDRTEVVRPLLESISVVDKPGIEADTCDITLKSEDMLATPERGTEVKVKLGFRGAGLSEVFSGVANRVGISGPPDLLFIQATGIALSDDKRLQGTHTRSWNEATLGTVLTDIIQAAGFKARVHNDLKDVEVKRVIQSIETDIELLSQLSKLYGGILKSDGETVAVVPRDSLERASGSKLPSVEIDRSETPKYSWDKQHRQGYKTVVAFYQENAEGAVKAHIEGSGEPELRLKPMFPTLDAATKAARKELGKIKRINTIQLTVPGRFVAVGSPLKTTGFAKDQMNGEFQVIRVSHSYKNGYTTQVEAEGE